MPLIVFSSFALIGYTENKQTIGKLTSWLFKKGDPVNELGTISNKSSKPKGEDGTRDLQISKPAP